jgi:hypothetical protein
MSFTDEPNNGLRITSSGNIGLGSISQLTQSFHIGGQLQSRQIVIDPVANGYSVKIGCQTFVFESLANLLYRIEEYYYDSERIEKHFQEHKTLPIILPRKK